MLNAKDLVKLDDYDEAINVITTLQKTTAFYNPMRLNPESPTTQKEGYSILQDINTVPEHNSIRFNINHLTSFIETAVSIKSAIMDDLVKGVS